MRTQDRGIVLETMGASGALIHESSERLVPAGLIGADAHAFGRQPKEVLGNIECVLARVATHLRMSLIDPCLASATDPLLVCRVQLLL